MHPLDAKCHDLFFNSLFVHPIACYLDDLRSSKYCRWIASVPVKMVSEVWDVPKMVESHCMNQGNQLGPLILPADATILAPIVLKELQRAQLQEEPRWLVATTCWIFIMIPFLVHKLGRHLQGDTWRESLTTKTCFSKQITSLFCWIQAITRLTQWIQTKFYNGRILFVWDIPLHFMCNAQYA